MRSQARSKSLSTILAVPAVAVAIVLPLSLSLLRRMATPVCTCLPQLHYASDHGTSFPAPHLTRPRSHCFLRMRCTGSAAPAAVAKPAETETTAEGLLTALAAIEDNRERFRYGQRVLSALPDGEPRQWELTVDCLEQLGGDPNRFSDIDQPGTGGSALASLVAGLVPAPQEEADASLRVRAMRAALQLASHASAADHAGKRDRNATRTLRHALRVLARWNSQRDLDQARLEHEVRIRRMGWLRRSMRHTLEALARWTLKLDLREAPEVRLLVKLFKKSLDNQLWDHVADMLALFPAVLTPHFEAAVADVATEQQLPRWLAEDRNSAEPGKRQRLRVEKHVSRGKPGLAVKCCYESELLRMHCIGLLVEVGLLETALDAANWWWLPCVYDSSASEAATRRAERFLPLPPNVSVTFIDSEEEALSAMTTLHSAEEAVIGLDVETTWNGKAVLLQLAARDKAFLFDLIELQTCLEFGTAVAALLTDATVTKLGFGGNQDVRLIAKLPAFGDFQTSETLSFIDIQALAANMRTEQRVKAGHSAIEGLSLAKIGASVLGKPLDKAMQMSDWTKRPLNSQQITYAAMDAWVLLPLFDNLQW